MVHTRESSYTRQMVAGLVLRAMQMSVDAGDRCQHLFPARLLNLISRRSAGCSPGIWIFHCSRRSKMQISTSFNIAEAGLDKVHKIECVCFGAVSAVTRGSNNETKGYDEIRAPVRSWKISAIFQGRSKCLVESSL